MTNPFQTMGLTPQILVKLSNQQIGELVRSQYRILVRIKHPDVGGCESEFKEIQSAYEELDQVKNPEKFQFHKAWYLKSKKDQMIAVKEKISLFEQEKDMLTGCLASFWSGLLEQPGSVNTPVWKLRSGSIIVQDIFYKKMVWKKTARKSHSSAGNHVKTGFEVLDPMYEIVIGCMGELNLYDVSVQPYLPRIHGHPPRESLIPHPSGNPIYVKRQSNLKSLTGSSLLGTIVLPNHIIDPKNPMGNVIWNPLREATALLPPQNGEEMKPWLQISQLKPYLPDLKPFLRVSDGNVRTLLVQIAFKESILKCNILGTVRFARFD